MANIKTTISFDEYMTIVNNVSSGCFPNDTYSPAYYELMLRYFLIKIFSPNYDLPDLSADNYNEIWENVMSREANDIIEAIKQTEVGKSLVESIDNEIGFRKNMIASGSMSMSDIALSKLLDVITEKADKIDTSILSQKDINAVTEAIDKSKDGNFAENLVDVMFDKGMLASPNRATRRKNGQTSKSKTINKNIAAISKESDT